MTPKQNAVGATAILCLHQTHNRVNLGMKEPVGLTGKLHYAQELTERGYVTLTPNYGVIDETSSDLSTKDPFDYRARGYCFTRGGVEYCNRWLRSSRVAIRAVDVIQALPSRPQRIGAIGHSAGAWTVLLVAAFDSRVGVVAESCGVSPWELYSCGARTGDLSGFQRLMPGLPREAARVPLRFRDILKTLAPRPLWCHEPLLDVITPGDPQSFPNVAACLTRRGFDPASNYEQAAIEAAREEAYRRVFDVADRIVAIYPRASHDFPPDIRRQAYEFLDRHLRV
jgi:hypothetical protein